MTGADIPVSVTMRFSYLGFSGWQGAASGNSDSLFDTRRLEARFHLFERIALASLAAQTDPGFHLHVLTSESLPGWALDRLRETSAAALGPARVTVDARPQGRVRKFHRIFLQQRYGETRIAQVVLDDDDGLAADFVEILRGRIQLAVGEGRLAGPADVHFLTFPAGYALVHAGAAAGLYRHRYKFINLGLTMIGPPGRSIHATLHQVDPERFGYTVWDSRPMFVRSVHDFNDSRVAVTPRWRRVPDCRAERGFRERFGYLGDLAGIAAG